MLSTRETKNAVSATSLIIDYVPASSEALAELLVTIRTRLSDAVTDIMVFILSIFIRLCDRLQNASVPLYVWTCKSILLLPSFDICFIGPNIHLFV